MREMAEKGHRLKVRVGGRGSVFPKNGFFLDGNGGVRGEIRVSEGNGWVMHRKWLKSNVI